MSQMLGQPGSVTDPLGIVSTTSHNADNGRVTGSAVLDGNDTVASLSYTYASGRLSAMTRTAMLPDATSFTQSCGMSYNAFGQTTGVSVGTIPLASYVYGANGGLLQSMSYGNGDSVEYAYDALARVRDVYYNESSTPSLHYGYAANGALGSLTDLDNDRLSVYGYDGLDRLLSMRESFDGDAVQVFRANYDAANRVSGTGYRVSPGWDGTLGELRSYGYTYSNTNGSLSSLTLPGGGTYAYSYDALRRLSSRTLSVGSSPFLTREYGYLAGAGTNDTTTLVSTLQNKAADGSTINAWAYTYDAAGRITSVTGDAHTRSYTYDAQGQLLCESASTGFFTLTWSYTYDTAGNLRSATRASSTSIDDPFDPWIPIPPTPTPAPMGGGADEQPRRSSSTTTVTYSYGNAQWPDLLTAYDGNSIVYDAIGNPTTWYDGAAMTWEKGRQLASIGATGEHAALSFSYNADGLRLTKTEGTGSSAVTHRYTWQGGRLIAEAYGDTELEFFYDESGQPYALLVRDTSTATPTEAWYFYVTNLQGDVVMLLDESGDAAAEYGYNAWGELIVSAGTMAAVNPIRYRGYYFDAETGLYYLQSRYYDPVVGRFLNADGYASTGQGILGCNMFAYCLDDPVLLVDSNGARCIFAPEEGSEEEYDRDAAIAYAEEWYDSFNRDYYRYRTDCTNFVSQCLSAGGIKQTDSWHMKRTEKKWWYNPAAWFINNYRYDWDVGEAWSQASKQYNYFSSLDGNNSVLISSAEDIAFLISSYNIQKGDILYFVNDQGIVGHAAIITSVDSSMIYYAGHTEQRFNEPLSGHISEGGVYVVIIGS